MQASDIPPPKIFINYRRSEASGWARLLYDRLAARFGAEHVFLDLVTLEPGAKWLADIRSRDSTCAAFIALIGPNWASIMNERARSPEPDQVRAEIEAALRRDSSVEEVIPALVDGAAMPGEKHLPSRKSLWPLLHRHAAHLRPSRWDADVEALIQKLEQIGGQPLAEPTKTPDEEIARKPLKPVAGPPDPSLPPPDPEDRHEGLIAPEPDRGHYDELARLIVEDGSVVPFLGPGANSSDRSEPWTDVESARLPDAGELATYLAHKLETTSEPPALAQASQHVSVAKGPGDLYMMLRKALPSRCPPTPVHRFLAGLPARMHRLGLPERYQVIVTTNYDDALERAFDEVEEPYDLAVYMASGPDKGRFVHVPHDGEPQAVKVANEYDGFPLEVDDYETTRTVIMKIHGAVDRARPPYAWRDNYVITEDDYIDYLVDGTIESIVPQELLGKLRYSHFLFLGYTMRDWNLRVFLKRVFGTERLLNNSWAIQRSPDKLDSRFWKGLGVDLFTVPLEEYVADLGNQLAAAAERPEP